MPDKYGIARTWTDSRLERHICSALSIIPNVDEMIYRKIESVTAWMIRNLPLPRKAMHILDELSTSAHHARRRQPDTDSFAPAARSQFAYVTYNVPPGSSHLARITYDDRVER